MLLDAHALLVAFWVLGCSSPKPTRLAREGDRIPIGFILPAPRSHPEKVDARQHEYGEKRMRIQ